CVCCAVKRSTKERVGAHRRCGPPAAVWCRRMRFGASVFVGGWPRRRLPHGGFREVGDPFGEIDLGGEPERSPRLGGGGEDMADVAGPPAATDDRWLASTCGGEPD